MENVVLCSQDYTVAAAQSLSRSVLTPAEQVELICLGDACFLKGFISENRFDEDVEPEFVENADLALIVFITRFTSFRPKPCRFSRPALAISCCSPCCCQLSEKPLPRARAFLIFKRA